MFADDVAARSARCELPLHSQSHGPIFRDLTRCLTSGRAGTARQLTIRKPWLKPARETRVSLARSIVVSSIARVLILPFLPDVVNLDALSVQQLSQVKKQFDEEVQHLTNSYQNLRVAQQKFKDCVVSVKEGVADSVQGRTPSTCLPYLSNVQHH